MRFTYYGGFDWAHDHHDVVIVDRRGQMMDDFAIQHTAEGWQRWCEQVAVLGTEKKAVCVETSHGWSSSSDWKVELRFISPRQQSTQTRLLAPHLTEPLIPLRHVNNSQQKTI